MDAAAGAAAAAAEREAAFGGSAWALPAAALAALAPWMTGDAAARAAGGGADSSAASAAADAARLPVSALAGLLRAAPPCVPFGQRLELFRALLAQDRASHAYSLPQAQGGQPPIKARMRAPELASRSPLPPPPPHRRLTAARCPAQTHPAPVLAGHHPPHARAGGRLRPAGRRRGRREAPAGGDFCERRRRAGGGHRPGRSYERASGGAF
jgi:hypothetical protein